MKKKIFGITVFSDFHTWLTGLSIKDFAVIPNIISSDLPALGEWASRGNSMVIYIYISMLLVFITLLIALVNKLKLKSLYHMQS